LASNAQVHSAFVSNFLDGKTGANNSAFVAYLRFLLSLAEEHYGRSRMADEMDLKITWVSEQNGDFVENHISEFGTFARVADKIERDLAPPEPSNEDAQDYSYDSIHKPKLF
jgi:hypothetical protein